MTIPYWRWYFYGSASTSATTIRRAPRSATRRSCTCSSAWRSINQGRGLHELVAGSRSEFHATRSCYGWRNTRIWKTGVVITAYSRICMRIRLHQYAHTSPPPRCVCYVCVSVSETMRVAKVCKLRAQPRRLRSRSTAPLVNSSFETAGSRSWRKTSLLRPWMS